MKNNSQMLWDKTMPLLRLIGDGSRTFLHGQTTSNFLEAKTDSFLRGCWLNTAGRVRALFEARLVDEGAELLVLGGDFDEVIQGFDQVIFPADQVRMDSHQSIRRVQPLDPFQPERFKNVVWLLPGQPLPKAFAGCQSATSSKFERWRMEHGLPIGIGELNAMNNPYELGLSNFVDLNKGCYLGQETMAKLDRVGRVQYQLRFWESASKLSVGQALTSSCSTSIEKKKVGVVTSVMRCGNIDSSFGLAMLRRQVLEERELYLFDDLSPVSIKVPIGFVGVP